MLCHHMVEVTRVEVIQMSVMYMARLVPRHSLTDVSRRVARNSHVAQSYKVQKDINSRAA